MNPNNTHNEPGELNNNLPPNSNPFSVPEGYFDGLAGSVMARINSTRTESALEEITALSPFLAGFSRSMPFEVPENYFTSTINDLSVIVADEKESSILSGISKQMPFFIPEPYFNTLPQTILKRTVPAGAKVIPMGRFNWKRMAVAAMITAIIGTSGIFYFNNKSSKDPIAQIKSASTNDIEAFLSNTGATLSGTATAQSVSGKNEIKAMLQNVPENEVDAFLNQVPEVESITN